ncbi:MAG: Type 1 glutamine amidotransferase-like domain-containing protein [Candidatus Sericytochromatia bacterium]
MTDQQIIALGGGGFSMENTPVLDDYILKACGKPNPKICFVPTACGDEDSYTVNFYRRFAPTPCRATDLQLMQRHVQDLEDFACSQDIIYVGGGNTANMLAIWRTHGFDRALKAALNAGTVLTGLSAGSICWFEQGVTDSFGADLQAMDGLGFLSGSHCPHYDGEAKRRPAYHRLQEQGMLAGWAADDSVGLHFINGKLQHVVSSRRGAMAYRVELKEGHVSESALTPVFLG